MWMLHSDIVGTDRERNQELNDPRTAPLIALSTIIGARGVTLPNMRYAFLHPKMRTNALHSSGLSQLSDEPLSVEVEGNQVGRVGRDADSLATLLYDVNDAEARLQDLQPRRPEFFRPQAMSTTSPAGCPLSERVPLFVIGAPSRLYHVRKTPRDTPPRS